MKKHLPTCRKSLIGVRLHSSILVLELLARARLTCAWSWNILSAWWVILAGSAIFAAACLALKGQTDIDEFYALAIVGVLSCALCLRRILMRLGELKRFSK